MASASLNPASDVQPVLRLATQLQSLSELTESLAFRLLELEERLAAQELRIESLVQAEGAESGHGADTELRLDDTEDRLSRLETLLSGLASPGAARQAAGVVALARPELLEEPFYDDAEQPFMDEQPFLDDALNAIGHDAEDDGRQDHVDRLSA